MAAVKKIGILGGSFNPPHLGHVAMARYVLQEGKVDQVWVVPCFEHAMGKPLVDFHHRKTMADLAFEELNENVQILDIERKLSGKSYTIRTVEELKRLHPRKEFWLILGEDAAGEAVAWHQYDALKKSVGWLVIPRGKNSPIPDISATEVREALHKKQGLEFLLPKNVIPYIRKHKLYI